MRRAIAGFLMLMFVGGCQPGVFPAGDAPRSSTESRSTASVAIRVAFPERAPQALVSNTQSVKIVLRDALSNDVTRTVNTGTATTVTFEGLPSGGGYALYAAAYSDLNATGTMLSWGKLPVTLASGRNQLNLSLSVVVSAGAAAADIITGPAGNGAVQLGAQRVFTTMADFQAPTATSSNIEVYDPSQNTYVSKFGTLGNLNGQFGSHIQMIAIDSRDRIWVSDDNNQRIVQFDKDGNFLRGIGSDQVWVAPAAAPVPATGSTNYGLNGPSGLTVDAQDNVYVSDTNNRRILKYDSSGNFLMGIGYNTPWFAPSAAPAVAALANAIGHMQPYGLDLDRSGNIYVGGMGQHRLHIFSPSGVFLRGIGQGTTWTSAAGLPATTASGNGASQFTNAWHVRVDENGTMYATDFNERVQVFNPSGAYVRTFSTASPDKPDQRTAGYLELGPDGNIYVAAYGSTPGPNFYQVFNRDGILLSRFGVFGTGDGQLQNPEGIAWASDGNFFTIDRDGSRVQRWRGANPKDPAGALRLRGHRQPDNPSYAASGAYLTPAVDAGSTIDWGSVYWDITTLPVGTSATIEAGCSSDGITWTWSLVTGSPGAGRTLANLVGVSGRFFKLRVTLGTSNAALSPVIQELGVMY
ncbi:MAG TPA: NHL repeat-containing protein [Pantanalinema sp.]